MNLLQGLSKKKLINRLVVIFLLLASIIFLYLENQRKSEVNNYLHATTKHNRLVYKTIYEQYKQLSMIIYLEIIKEDRVLQIYQELESANRAQKTRLRKELLGLFENKYSVLKSFFLKQLHFHLKDNESFLRFHRPNKYGDNLTSVRKTIAYVNKYHESIDGFEEGRIYNGYRFVYPIQKGDKHLGSVEVSFGAEAFISSIMRQYNIFSNFLVSSHIVNQKVFTSEKSNYRVSCYNDFLFDNRVLAQIEKQEEQQKDIQSVKPSFETINKIFKGLENQESLSVYEHKSQTIFTVIPEFNPLTKEMVAFLIIKERTNKIETINSYAVQKLVLGLMLLLAVLLIIFLIFIKKDTLEHKAYLDVLTGVYNRNRFNDIFKYEIQRSQRYGNKFSLAILDIDHFKRINDTYGHLVGDEILKMLASFVSANIRRSDIFARWGGEEFVVLFVETGVNSAQISCENLRKGVEELSHDVAGKVTVSFGVTEYRGENETSKEIFDRCDRALYKAKETGRNKVEIL